MSKAARLTLLLLAVAAAAATIALLLPDRQPSAPVARITLAGEPVQEIDLATVAASFSFDLQGPSGLTNTVLVEHGRICVSHATCPDQICVRQGFISDSSSLVVCLPNQLMIQIIGGGEALDAATG